MKAEFKKFHIGDILSITTGLLVSKDKMEGVRNILEYMENIDLATIGLAMVKDRNTKILESFYPQLSANNMKDEMVLLTEQLSIATNKDEVVNIWLKNVEERFGAYFDVPKQYYKTNPKEMAEILEEAANKNSSVVRTVKP